jgi:hypothetical protein
MKKLYFAIFSAYLFAASVIPVEAIIVNPVLKNNEIPSRNPMIYFNSVIQAVVSIFIIVGVVYFIWHIFFAGYHLIGAEGDPKKWETGKNEIIYSTIGLFSVFAIFAILKFVGTVLGIVGLETLTIPWPSI